MAVSEQTPYQEFIANGTTTVFPLNFDAKEQDHLIVLVDDVEPQVGEWSFDFNTDQVTFLKAPKANSVIKIRRDTPLERTTTYKTYDNSFRPEVVNHDFDRIWYKLQELSYTDFALMQKIITEILARTAGDQILQDQILAEIKNRKDADFLLQDQTSDNKANIVQLKYNLSQEIKNRVLSDNQVAQSSRDYTDFMLRMNNSQNIFDGISDNVVMTKSGESQRRLNDKTVYFVDSEFELLSIASPNLNQIAYVTTTSAHYIYNGITWINQSESYVNYQKSSNNFTHSLNELIKKVSKSGGGEISLPNGVFDVDTSISIQMLSNIKLKLNKGTTLLAIPTSNVGGDIIQAVDVTNVSIVGGSIDGNRDNMVAPNGSKWRHFSQNTNYTTGEYVWYQRYGCIVISGGISTVNPETGGILPVIGSELSSGNVILKTVVDVGEWGMGVGVRGVTGIHIDIDTIKNCWGDGLYFGASENQNHCKNVTFGHIEIYNCRRQGVSVISVDGMVGESLIIRDINGTLPEAGIDFEPNRPSEMIKGVVIKSLTTSKCKQAGCLVSVHQLNDSSDDIEIEILKHTDSYSVKGYQSLGRESSPAIGGYVRIFNANYTNVGMNIFAQNHNADGYQTIFYDPILTSDSSNPDYFIRVSNASADYSLGGVHLIRPTFRAKQKAPASALYLYANNNNAIANKNISLEDIVAIPTTTTPFSMIAREVGGFNISDVRGLNARYLSVSSSINNSTIYNSYIFDGTTNSTFTVTGFTKGRVFKIYNRSLNSNLTVTMMDGLNIVDYTSENVRSFVLSPGGVVELIANSTVNLLLVSASNMLRSGKKAPGIANLPSGVVVPAYGVYKVGEYSNLVFNRYSDVLIGSPSLPLGGGISVMIDIVSAKNYAIYLQNSTAIDYTTPTAPNHYINVAVI